MNSVAYLVLLGWVPFGLLLFAALPARRAALAVLSLGWLFLPILEIPLPGIPDFDKPAAVSYSLLLGVLIFDAKRLTTLRVRLCDVAMLAWILAGPLASLANQLGTHDALAQIWQRSFNWGVPYLIGRLYLNSPAGVRDFLWTLFLSGLLYAPFALWEIRMSPQLHRIVYGEAQHFFAQTMRGGGWRPMVFMRHGLELSLYMAMAAFAGVTLWRHGRVKKVAGIPSGLLVTALVGTVVLCKSTGATLLLLLSIGLSWGALGLWTRRALMAGIPAFLTARIASPGSLEGALVDTAALLSPDRASSLAYRFANEQLLMDNVLQNLLIGSGSWTFLNATDSWTGQVQTAVPDSLWIIAIATTGLVGLVSLQLFTWLPAARAVTSRSSAPELVGAGLILSMTVLDGLVNALVPAIVIALAGGLSFYRSGQPAAALAHANAGAPRRRPLLQPRASATATTEPVSETGQDLA